MHDWEKYVSELIGAPVHPVPDESAVARLSIGMGAVYAVYRGQILDQTTRFMVPKTPGGPSLPDLLRHYPVLRKSLEGDIVLVLPAAKPYEVKRLIAERIPFVIPGRQLFLPRNVVLMQGPATAMTERNHGENPLSPRAQALVMFHLQRKSLASLPQNKIASLLRWTPMTVSRAIQELQQKRLCYTLPGGRSNMLSMAGGRILWEHAEPWLTNPVRTRRFVRLLKPTARAMFCDAGMTALSRYSMIAQDPVPVLAMYDRAFSKRLLEGAIEVCPYQDEGCIQAELWRYDPAPLAEENTVDRLSLYLTLKSNPDERVQGALKELLEGVRW